MLRRALKAFLPDERNKAMFPLFICFCIALIGFTIGFASGNAAPYWLRVASSLLVLGGVFCGFLLIIFNAFSGFRSLIRAVTGK